MKLDKSALDMRIKELEVITGILKELAANPQRDPKDFCREKEIDFGRFLYYAGDIIKSDAVNIEDLDLSVRSFNCLKRAGIDKISELAQMTIVDIGHIRNMGWRSTAEIVLHLAAVGITLEEGDMNQIERRNWIESYKLISQCEDRRRS